MSDPKARAFGVEGHEPPAGLFRRESANLPPELQRFLSQPLPRSLLIRGPPGTGKTTLALGLLEAFTGRRVFVSHRVRRDEVFGDFPWLESGGDSLDVVYAPTVPGSVQLSARALSLLRAQTRLAAPSPRSGGEASSTSDDADRAMWLPPALRQLWLTLDRSAPTLVAIDSWDGLVEAYLGADTLPTSAHPAREEIERILVDLMSGGGARLVLLLERDEPSQLDYLCDGVVVLRRGTDDAGRLERWLLVEKLRGTECRDRHYPFTLLGARFESFPEGPDGLRRLRVGADPEPEPAPGNAWPGSRAYADVFGRLPLGHATMVELGPSVPNETAWLLAAPAVVHALRQGGRALLFPALAAAVPELRRRLEEAASPEAVRDRLRIPGMLPEAMPEAQPQDGFIRSPGWAAERGLDDRVRFRFAIDFERTPTASGTPNLAVGFLNRMHDLFDPAVAGSVAQAVPLLFDRLLSDAPVHLFLLFTRGEPLAPLVTAQARTHLLLEARSGHTFVAGVRPWTRYYALLPRNERPDPERAPYGLVPVE